MAENQWVLQNKRGLVRILRERRNVGAGNQELRLASFPASKPATYNKNCSYILFSPLLLFSAFGAGSIECQFLPDF
jgi:hypothetical protein